MLQRMSDWSRIFHTLGSSSNLHELRLAGTCTEKKDSPRTGFDFINCQQYLETVIDLSHTGNWSPNVPNTQWTKLFRIMQNSTLEELWLESAEIEDSILQALTQFASSNRYLRVINILKCQGISSRTWPQFARMLAHHNGIMKIDINWKGAKQDSGSNAIELFGNAIQVNTSLKQLCLCVSGISKLETIAKIVL